LYQFDDDYSKGLGTLVKLGLTGLQGRILSVLIGSKGLTILEISKAIGVHRSDVYRTIKSLVDLGLVEVAVENPTRYHGVEPQRAVRLLLDARRNDLAKLESETDRLTDWLEERGSENIASPGGEETKSDFRLVRSKSVIPKVAEYIQSAEKEIIKVVSSNALRRHYVEFSPYEQKASARGVTVRVLTEINNRDMMVAKDYGKWVHLNHVANLDNSLRYMVVDGTQLVLAGTLNSDEGLDRVILITRNLVMVKGCMSYFEELWSKSVPAKERLRVLSETSDEMQADPNDVGGSRHPYASYKR
jgi:sugar-specific transcriptional regulator TrmB